MTRKNIYFASDFHLGAPNYEASLEREKRIVRWLDTIKEDTDELYLLGDLFDFWFEYGKVVPKGFIRLLGKLAEFSDAGIPLHIFTGNHDLWMRDYLEKELNAKIYREPVIRELDGNKFYLAHGDGLGPGDHGFKFIKKIFTNKACQWLFARLHPNTGVAIADYFSKTSRATTGEYDSEFLGEDKEWLILHSKEVLKTEDISYFIYGHRHFPFELKLNNSSKYINLGDWIKYNSYARWDGEELKLLYFGQDEK